VSRPKKTKKHTGIDWQLAWLVSSPTRIQAFTILADRVASPSEIARLLREPLSSVSHHVIELHKMRLTELVKTEARRGAIEHFYRAVRRPLLNEEEWSKISIGERQRFSIWIIQLILTDASKAFMAKLFDRRTNRHLSRTPLYVDETGFEEAIKIQARALDELLEVKERSANRLAEADEEGFHAIAGMMCFETPDAPFKKFPPKAECEERADQPARAEQKRRRERKRRGE
jgi:DNA-binding transcriptional ArsR family regulator